MTKNGTGRGRLLRGVVTSDKMDKTVVVQVTRRVLHPHFKKFVVRRKKYKAHDERNEYRQGDTVQIAEARPFSREKRWRVCRLLVRPEIA